MENYDSAIAASVPPTAAIRSEIKSKAPSYFNNKVNFNSSMISNVATFSDGGQGLCLASGSGASKETVAFTLRNGKIDGGTHNHPLCSRSDVPWHNFNNVRMKESAGKTAQSSKPSTSSSRPDVPNIVAKSDGSFCGNQAHMAAQIMDARQVGVPAGDALNVFRSGDEFDRIGRLLVKLAYSEPAYSTYDYQVRAVREFANTIRINCER